MIKVFVLGLLLFALAGCRNESSVSGQGSAYGVAGERVHANKILKKQPDNVSALFTAAGADVSSKNFPAAEEKLNRILATHPDDKNAKLRLAQVYGFQGKKEGAINIYNQFVNDKLFGEMANKAIAKLEKDGVLQWH